VDPHLLRTFIAVATSGSFSAAAAELGYTQSAVSQHIAALENSLGTALLTRRPVAPTPAGERLLEHAGAILLRIEAARADVRRAVGDPPGDLTIAASPLAAAGRVDTGQVVGRQRARVPAGPRRLAEALSEARRGRPGTAVSMTVCGREAVAHGVAAGEFHLGLIDGIAAPSDPLRLFELESLRSTAVAHEDLVVVLTRDHPLAQRRRIGLNDLVDAQWIDAPDVAAPLPDLRAATETDGIRAALTYSGTDILCLLALVAAGHGLAVLPASLHLPADVAAVPVYAPRLVHRTELLHGHLDGPRADDLAAALTAPAIRRTP
jgi:DNA-binding transcriptional LysR family regulator